MQRTRNYVTLGLALGLVALCVAQGPPAPIVSLLFDGNLQPTPPAAAEVQGDVPQRVVAQEGGQAAVCLRSGLTLDLPQPIGPRGAVTFGLQPLAPLDDSVNHRYFTTGPDGQAGSLSLWKTGAANDLRFRAWLPDGKYVDVIFPGAGRWEPGVWHFISASWEPQVLRLVIDGNLIGTVKLPDGYVPQTQSCSLGVGFDGREPASACLDDVRLYNQPRTGNWAQRDFEGFLSAERPDLAIPYDRPPCALAMDLLPPADQTFAIVSDMHIPAQGKHGRYQHEERVEELVKQLNELNPDFILDGGDINTSFPGRPDFDDCNKNAKRILDGLKPPIYHAPGNHDVGNKHQFDNEPFKGWFVSPENIATYQSYFGPDHFAVQQAGGLYCLLVNNQVFNSLPEQDEAQWQWLVGELKQHRDQKLLVVMHNPLFWVDLNDKGQNNYEIVSEPRRSQFVELCREYGVRAVFTGHTHHAISNLVDKTWLLTLPSTTFARNFGNNYGLPGATVVWDPARIGFLLARVKGDRITYRTIRTYAPLAPERVLLQGQPAPKTQMVQAANGDLTNPPIGLVAPQIPRVERGAWHVDLAIDGVASPPPGESLENHAWTSEAHKEENPTEFIEVDLPAPLAAAKLELWARGDGRGFPTAAKVSLRDKVGGPWTEMASWSALPEGIGKQPWSLELGGRNVAGVRVDITGMMPMHQGPRASLAEVVLLDANGRDRATSAAGATASAGSSAGGDKRTVNDNLWQAARDVGVQDMFLGSEQLAWADAGPTPDPDLVRACNLGRVTDLRLWLPVTLTPPAGTKDANAALRAYARRLATEYGPGVGGLLVEAAAGCSAADVQQAFETVRSAAGKLPVGVRLASAEQLGGLAAVLSRAACLVLPDAPAAVWDSLGNQVGGDLPVWVEVTATGPDPAAQAAAFAQRAATLLGPVKVLAPAPGTAGGVLTRTGTPTPLGQVIAAFNTLLDGAGPGDGETFVRPDGARIQVLCDPNRNGAAVTVPGPGRTYLVDPLRGTMAKLSDSGQVTVNLTAQAAPVVLVSLR